MKKRLCMLALVLVLLLASSCDGNGAISPSPPASEPYPETCACPPAQAGGTVLPAIAICSITYIVNGTVQIVRDGDTLQASRGDQVRVGEAAVYVGPFSGDGGDACVDFVPVDGVGDEQHVHSRIKDAKG